MIVDWSAAGTPKTGRDSIWICAVGRDGRRTAAGKPADPPCGDGAAARIAGRRHAARRARAGRVRFSVRLSRPVSPPVWVLPVRRPGAPCGTRSRLCSTDDERNRNNRFEVGAMFNRACLRRPVSVLGLSGECARDRFSARRITAAMTAGSLAEKRLIDTWMVGAQPCWKLAYTGSVGSQALTGIPVVRALARRSALGRPRPHLAVRDRALLCPDETRIVFAEVWPSWWPIRPWNPETPKDKAQVRTRRRDFRRARTAPANWRAGWPAARPRRRAGPHDRDRGGLDARGHGAAPSRPVRFSCCRRRYT